MKEVVELFVKELRKLHEKMDWPSYKSTTLSLKVTFSQEKPIFNIEWQGDYSMGSIKGTDLGRVMDEVYHRLGYEDRTEAEINSSLIALEAPRDDEIRF